MKKKIMLIFGTRPEAIKMCPLVKSLERDSRFECLVCVTGQHREMLDQVLEVFHVKPHYDFKIMTQNQSLSQITSRILEEIDQVLIKEQPHMILVHGDTSTTFAGALGAFYNKIPVGHVEAGLRSGDKWSPFPEEVNRGLTSRIADLNFAPTAANRQNLLDENIAKSSIFLTGNTVIDALNMVVEPDYCFEDEVLKTIDFEQDKVILLTAHRRENLGEPMVAIFRAIKRLVADLGVKVIYPIHLNPKVRAIAKDVFGDMAGLYLIEPLTYKPFVNLMAKSYMVMTDSGGLQEEAPALGKPVLVLRRETERPEAVEAGTVAMVGVDEEAIYSHGHTLITQEEAYHKMAKAVNPYGTGDAVEKIIQVIASYFSQ